jgi:hypothetical protein
MAALEQRSRKAAIVPHPAGPSISPLYFTTPGVREMLAQFEAHDYFRTRRPTRLPGAARFERQLTPPAPPPAGFLYFDTLPGFQYDMCHLAHLLALPEKRLPFSFASASRS